MLKIVFKQKLFLWQLHFPLELSKKKKMHLLSSPFIYSLVSC